MPSSPANSLAESSLQPRSNEAPSKAVAQATIRRLVQPMSTSLSSIRLPLCSTGGKFGENAERLERHAPVRLGKVELPR